MATTNKIGRNNGDGKTQPSVSLTQRKRKTSARAYVLLRTVDGCAGDAVLILWQIAGVVTVDKLEGPPDILIVIEAPDRPKLAEAVSKVLASVELVTDSVELLPVQDSSSIALIQSR